MAKILVTGGPVHTHLDSVKIITNRFKGGRMVALAEALREKGHFITFIGSPFGKVPGFSSNRGLGVFVEVHQGFADYRRLVKKHAAENDMVILGAAVANLIPCPPWDVSGKFPSHDYEVGDEITVPFRVAPRIINEVKKANPRTTLVGFKLLQNVEREELIRAAQLISSESNAAFVIANDANDLSSKFIVTRERSVIPALDVMVARPDQAFLESIGCPEILVDFLDQVARDEHYTTDWVFQKSFLSMTTTLSTVAEAEQRYWRLVKEHKETIEGTGSDGETVLGCVAVAVDDGGFIVSARGKKGLDEPPVYVSAVNHEKRFVVSHGGKPSLNAPLLDWVFRDNPHIGGLLHHHGAGDGLYVYPYAPPGTVRDSQRQLDGAIGRDARVFEIEHHGAFRLLSNEECNV
jgi:hypothetical protein